MVTKVATATVLPAKAGSSAPVYSPMTIATAAVVPQVEIQSLQPTIKPAYGPSARRAKLYWPPERGIIVPSSASENAPSSA